MPVWLWIIFIAIGVFIVMQAVKQHKRGDKGGDDSHIWSGGSSDDTSSHRQSHGGFFSAAGFFGNRDSDSDSDSSDGDAGDSGGDDD